MPAAECGRHPSQNGFTDSANILFWCQSQRSVAVFPSCRQRPRVVGKTLTACACHRYHAAVGGLAHLARLCAGSAPYLTLSGCITNGARHLFV